MIFAMICYLADTSAVTRETEGLTFEVFMKLKPVLLYVIARTKSHGCYVECAYCLEYGGISQLKCKVFLLE